MSGKRSGGRLRRTPATICQAFDLVSRHDSHGRLSVVDFTGVSVDSVGVAATVSGVLGVGWSIWIVLYAFFRIRPPR